MIYVWGREGRGIGVKVLIGEIGERCGSVGCVCGRGDKYEIQYQQGLHNYQYWKQTLANWPILVKIYSG